jgi:hypothetical protein
MPKQEKQGLVHFVYPNQKNTHTKLGITSADAEYPDAVLRGSAAIKS